MEVVPGTNVHLLPLERHVSLAASLGPAVSRAITPTGVSVPVLSALNVCYPGALCTSVSLEVGHGLIATVGNLLKLGPATLGFAPCSQTIAGVVVQCAAGISTTSKAGRLAFVTGFQPDEGSSSITCLPLFDLAHLSSAQCMYKLHALGEALSAGELGNAEQLLAETQDGAKCIGALTLVMGKATHEEVQRRCFHNMLIMALCISCHIVEEAQALMQHISSLLGLPLAPLLRISSLRAASSEDESQQDTDYGTALPEDVEAELSYDYLDQEYLREVERQAGVVDMYDEDDCTDGDSKSGNRLSAPCNTRAAYPRFNREDEHDHEPSFGIPVAANTQGVGASAATRPEGSSSSSSSTAAAAQDGVSDAPGSAGRSAAMREARTKDSGADQHQQRMVLVQASMEQNIAGSMDMGTGSDAAEDMLDGVALLTAGTVMDDQASVSNVAVSAEDASIRGKSFSEQTVGYDWQDVNEKAAVKDAAAVDNSQQLVHDIAPDPVQQGIQKHVLLALMLVLWLVRNLNHSSSAAQAAVLAAVFASLLAVQLLSLGRARFWSLLTTPWTAAPLIMLLACLLHVALGLHPAPSYLPTAWNMALTCLPLLLLVHPKDNFLPAVLLFTSVAAFPTLQAHCSISCTCLLREGAMLLARYFTLPAVILITLTVAQRCRVLQSAA